MSIAQNTALFSLLGTTYGGNGQTTFGLPDFRSRTAVGTGQGAGLSNCVLGEMEGTETVTLTVNQIPSHNHVANGTVSPGAFSGSGGESNPVGQWPASSPDLYSTTASGSMGKSPATLTIQVAGSSAPHINVQPYLGMNYIICLYGIFPSRN